MEFEMFYLDFGMKNSVDEGLGVSSGVLIWGNNIFFVVE